MTLQIKIKRLIIIVLSLTALQAMRAGTNFLLFQYIDRTVSANNISSMIYMAAVSILLFCIAKKQNNGKSILPHRFSKLYIVATAIAAILFISTPFITKSLTSTAIIALIYGALVTPVFEELLFRAVIWDYMPFENEIVKIVVNSFLFGIWHFGYVDTIIWRTSIFHPGADILNIMIWKAITGAVIGVMLGILRYKSKNAYSSFLLHCMINTFGS